jgi:hypothetical protein
MFRIGQIRFDFDGLGINDVSRNLNKLPKLGYMEDVMDGRQLRRKLKTLSYGSINFKDFKGSDVSGSKFPFYASATVQCFERGHFKTSLIAVIVREFGQ